MNIQTTGNRNNALLYLGYIASVTYLVMGLVFARERLFSDSAGYLFQIMNNESFAVMHKRFVSVFAQILPVIFTKLSLHPKVVFYSFFFNDWLYFFICSLILLLIQKNKTAFGLLWITLTVSLTWSFYSPVSELIQGFPLLLIIVINLSKGLHKFYQYLINYFLIVIVLYSHPIYNMFVPLCVATLYLSKNRYPNKQEIILFSLVLITIIVRYIGFDTYENSPLENINPGAGKGALYNLTKFRFGTFLSYTIFKYTGALILVLLTVLFTFTHKRIFLTFTTFLILWLYIVIIKFGLIFPESPEPFERFIFPILMFSCIILSVLIDIRISSLAFILLAIGVIFQVARRIEFGTILMQRYTMVQWIIESASQQPYQKFYLNSNNLNPFLMSGWILTNETPILCAINDKPIIQLATTGDIPENKIKELSDDQYFFFPWWVKNYSTINSRYFKMSKTPFVNLNSYGEQSQLPDSLFRVNISFFTNKYTLKAGKEAYIPVTIYNNNKQPIASGLGNDQIFISYHYIDSKGNFVWDGLRTPLLTDIKSSLTQYVKIKAPDVKGDCVFEFDIMFEGKKWCDIKDKIILTVE